MTLAQNAADSASMGKPSPVCGSAAGAAAFTVRVPAIAADAVTAVAAVSAWIEILLETGLPSSQPVALLAEGVDRNLIL